MPLLPRTALPRSIAAWSTWRRSLPWRSPTRYERPGRPREWGDPCSAEILRLSVDWIRAGELKTAVKTTTDESERTITRRIADVIKAGALEPMGAKASQRYRNTFLLG